MEAVSLAVLGALAYKIIDELKFIRNRDWNAAFTQAAAWVAGVVVVVLASNANAFQGLVIPGMTEPLAELNFPSLLMIGMSMSSGLSVVFDFKKALDGSDSAKTPPLIE